ncbi:hypothetical protein, partial [Lactiplantibacillus mudanjiangensis]|uniref:hypothetical protein n=1 Tax=Lactiplantibacillus mudanjiangensis TaxID=1296538 RepID=UPI0013EF5B1E
MMVKRRHLIGFIVLIEILAIISISDISLKIANQKNDVLVNQSTKAKVHSTARFFSNSNLLGADSHQWKLNSELSKYLNEIKYNGTISMYRNKHLIFQRGYGKIDKETTIYYDYNTIFPLYSIQKEFNRLLLLDVANQKNQSIQARKNYISNSRRQFSISDLVLNKIKLTDRDLTELTGKNVKSFKDALKQNSSLKNELAIVYLTQKLSGTSYEQCVAKFANRYQELNISTVDSASDLNEIKNESTNVNVVNNVSMDTQSLAVVQSLFQSVAKSNQIDANKILQIVFPTRLDKNNYLLNQYNV